MFTTGFDLGTENCVIAVARKGGIDIIANEASYRTTPALVTFGEEQRYIGQSAQAQFKRNVASTVSNVKRLLGRRFDEEDVQKELPFLSFKIKALDDNNEIGIELRQAGEVKTFTPVQVCAALLGQLKRTAEDSLQQAVQDVVIGVPHWWNDRQRRALLDAAKIAGLNCLQLVNELTACGLELGIRKDRTLDKESELVCFFDMGHTQTQCAVMRYSKGKLEVLGYGYDHHLGGRNFTEAIVEHFRQEWQGKYKIDVATNPRAKLRTTEACQKLKHVLSSNATGNVNLDCLMEDRDVSGKLDRDTFVGMVQPLLERVLEPVRQALAAAGVKKEDVVSVEVVGDSHRIPAVASQLQEFFGKPPSKRTNATEVVAKGSAWQCARKSPVFKVVPYELKDLQSYPINFGWNWGSKGEEGEADKAGEGPQSQVFAANSVVPIFKQVTFKKKIVEGMTFAATAAYADGTVLPAGTSKHLGSWTINSIPLDPPAMEGEKAALKIGCKLDDSGVVSVSRAEKEWTEQVEYEELEEVPLSAEEQKEADAKAAEEAAAAAAKTETKEDEAAADGEKKEEGAEEGEKKEAAAEGEKKKEEKPEAKQPKTKKVKVTKKKSVARSAKLEIVAQTPSLSDAAIRRLAEEEKQMQAHDRLVIDTAAEKNKVEAFVYESREQLSGAWSSFATEEHKDKLRALLEQTENWLYEEGDSVTKDVYSAKLAEMHALSDPVALRAREAEEREPAVEALRKSIQEWQAWSQGADPAFAHLTAEEKQSTADRAKAAQEWLDEHIAKQQTLAPTDPPAVLSADIVARRQNLEKENMAVRNKPKPKPKPEEKKPEEAKKEDKPQAAEPAAAAEGAAEKPAADGDEKPEPMDTTN